MCSALRIVLLAGVMLCLISAQAFASLDATTLRPDNGLYRGHYGVAIGLSADVSVIGSDTGSADAYINDPVLSWVLEAQL